MPKIWRCAPFLLAVVSIAGLHCDSTKSTKTQSSSSALRGEGGFAGALPKGTSSAITGSVDASKPPREPGPAEWYTCKKADDCTLVYETSCCLPDCDPLSFAGYTAVSTKHKADFVAHIGCADAKCPKCNTPLPDIARSDSNFLALCQQDRCVPVDLRYSKYSQCKTAKDCALRYGLGCCESCGDKELVTYNPASTLNAELCPTKTKCPPLPPECKKLRSPSQHPECVLNQCQLSD